MSLFHPTDAPWLRARTTAPSSFGISPRSKRPPHSTDIERRVKPSPFRPTANIWPAAAGRCASGTRLPSKKLPRQARQRGRRDEYAGRTALRGHSLFFPGSSNTFLRLPRNLRLLFLLYRMKPLITPGTAWLARAGVESRINKTNTNNQVRVTWHKTTKTQAQT